MQTSAAGFRFLKAGVEMGEQDIRAALDLSCQNLPDTSTCG